MKILLVDEVSELTTLSRATIYRKEREGSFPLRIQLGVNRTGWIEEEVHEWIKNLPRGARNGNHAFGDSYEA